MRYFVESWQGFKATTYRNGAAETVQIEQWSCVVYTARIGHNNAATPHQTPPNRMLIFWKAAQDIVFIRVIALFLAAFAPSFFGMPYRKLIRPRANAIQVAADESGR